MINKYLNQIANSSFKILISIFVGLSFFLFANTLTHQLVWDDHAFIETNDLQTPATLENILTGQYPIPDTGSLRPIRGIVYFLLHTLFPEQPLPYRLLIISIHGITSFLVFNLATILSGKKLIGLFSGLLFLTHPIHVEAVAWNTAGMDLIFPPLFIGAIIAYLYYFKTNNSKFEAIFYSLSLLAFLTNEIAIMLPAIIIAYRFIFQHISVKDTLTHRRLIPLYISAIAYFIFRSQIITTRELPRLFTSPLENFFILPLTLLGKYLSILIFPARLTPDHYLGPNLSGLFAQNFLPNQFPNSLSMTHPMFAMGIIGVVFTLVSIKFFPSIIKFFSLWIILTLLPMLQLIQTPIILAERYAYLSSVGFAIISGWLIFSLKRFLHPNATFIFFLTLIASYSYLTFHQNQIWATDKTLWEDTLTNNPHSAVAMNSLGTYYSKQDNFDQANHYYFLTLLKNPSGSIFTNNYVKLFRKYKNPEALLSLYHYLRTLFPQEHHYLLLIGDLYEFEFNQFEQAKDFYLQALEQDPTNIEYQQAVAQIESKINANSK